MYVKVHKCLCCLNFLKKLEIHRIRNLFSVHKTGVDCLSLLFMKFNGIDDKLFEINGIRQHKLTDGCSMYIIVINLWSCL